MNLPCSHSVCVHGFWAGLLCQAGLRLQEVSGRSAPADNHDSGERQSEDDMVSDGLQVEDDVEDPVKARELRLEGNEHFKVLCFFIDDKPARGTSPLQAVYGAPFETPVRLGESTKHARRTRRLCT